MNAPIKNATVKPSKTPVPKKKSSVEMLGDAVGDMGDLMQEGDQFANVPLKAITIKVQVRTELYDEENTAEEMRDSIKAHGVIQPVLLRPTPNGPTPYELVAGERRYRGSVDAGKETIPAIIREMSDAVADELQYVENVQRKNLRLIEDAQKIQREINELGSVAAVLAKYKKGKSWLSKILSMLTLPEQAQRVVDEKISADRDVINKVKEVEKVSKEKAKHLVDNLKATRGKADARKMADKVLEEVKPATAAKAAKKAAKQAEEAAKSAKTGTVATPKDESEKEPGEVESFAEAKPEQDEAYWPFPGSDQTSEKTETPAPRHAAPLLPPSETLNRAYGLISESGTNPRVFLETLEKEDRADVEAWLNDLYDAGAKAPSITEGVVKGFQSGTFAKDGYGAFAMIAYLQGAEKAVAAFSAIAVLGMVKP
ncbi:ParB/RepB/Spo0J family partition protein [Massilia sp. CCM 9210]|uniref:ParB/RepB/Spo0J family partition protein n=1 Tax=Massilia scottii TaxID=3057166 RepID=UPI002796500F|nr:ParB/RepB/Spo0J family partition protein [Massilia sp. CCM 9210]MDQ1817811.1 ParB/RepB/Spo0J family partition protein [Massilia sp. CCM 9210]